MPVRGRGKCPRPPARDATREPRLSGRLDLTGDMLQRDHDLLDRLGGDAGLDRRAIELGVTEQDLDHSDIDVLFQKMGGEAVP